MKGKKGIETLHVCKRTRDYLQAEQCQYLGTFVYCCGRHRVKLTKVDKSLNFVNKEFALRLKPLLGGC